MKNTTIGGGQLAKKVEYYDYDQEDQEGRLAALADRGIRTFIDLALPISNESSKVTL